MTLSLLFANAIDYVDAALSGEGGRLEVGAAVRLGNTTLTQRPGRIEAALAGTLALDVDTINNIGVLTDVHGMRFGRLSGSFENAVRHR